VLIILVLLSDSVTVAFNDHGMQDTITIPTKMESKPIDRVRQIIPSFPTHRDITRLKLAYSIPLLIDPDSKQNQETNLLCQLFTIIHILRESEGVMFSHKSYPNSPDIVVPIHHISNNSWHPSVNVTNEANRLGVIFIYGAPCGLPKLTGSNNFSLLDYHESYRTSFMVLNSFGLVSYDHVIHLDSNIYLHAEALEYFWHTSFSQASDVLWGYYFSSKAPITSALLLIRPSGEAYSEMCRILDDGFEGPDRGWNHHGRFLSDSWCDNLYMGCTKPQRWTFNGANTALGLVYYYYHVKLNSWLGAVNIIVEKKFDFYTSNRKPWLPSNGRVWKPSWYSWEVDFFKMVNESPDEELCQSVRLELMKWPKPRKRLQSCPLDELLKTFPLPGFYLL